MLYLQMTTLQTSLSTELTMSKIFISNHVAQKFARNIKVIRPRGLCGFRSRDRLRSLHPLIDQFLFMTQGMGRAWIPQCEHYDSSQASNAS